MSSGVTAHKFASLSVRDLLDAREAYHVHLVHLENVVGTSVGRYRFKKGDPKEHGPRGSDEPKTLGNSEVRETSWPCVLVFVTRWIPTAEFRARLDEIVPPRLYLPDGRVVPTCVILAEKYPAPVDEIDTLRFPDNMLGGGYPLLADVQEQTRVATIGCLVSDGDCLYALTNAHVAGADERALTTLVGGRPETIGTSGAARQGRRLPFEQAYPGFPGPRSVLNLDAALVRAVDANRWTSQVYGIGQFDELADLNVDSVTLDLIGCPVVAFGAASGEMRGQIDGLFYRYRSVGGQDQISDLIIGPRDGEREEVSKLARHGNSGAVWFLEQQAEDATLKRRPIGLHWGSQHFVAGSLRERTGVALAASLGVICRELGVDIVRDVNIGLPETWGKVGHYKVGQLACRLATDPKLHTLLDKNESRISYRDAITEDIADPHREDPFVPLADVADVVWKSGGQSVRGKEGPNHFADMDQPAPNGGKALLDLCQDPAFIDPQKWNAFYQALSIGVMHRGLLPFRVWQLFDEMVDALSQQEITRYVAAAGVLAHYVGDACQPLHASMLHDGDPQTGRGKGVHSAYETDMLNRNAPALNARIAQVIAASAPQLTDVASGFDAAREIVQLMTRAIGAVPPTDLIDTYEAGNHHVAKLWAAFGNATAERVIDGATVLASIWRGAWRAGHGDALTAGFTAAARRDLLAKLYMNRDWAPSVTIDRMTVTNGVLTIT